MSFTKKKRSIKWQQVLFLWDVTRIRFFLFFFCVFSLINSPPTYPLRLLYLSFENRNQKIKRSKCPCVLNLIIFPISVIFSTKILKRLFVSFFFLLCIQVWNTHSQKNFLSRRVHICPLFFSLKSSWIYSLLGNRNFVSKKKIKISTL